MLSKEKGRNLTMRALVLLSTMSGHVGRQIATFERARDGVGGLADIEVAVGGDDVRALVGGVPELMAERRMAPLVTSRALMSEADARKGMRAISAAVYILSDGCLKQ